MIGSGVAGTVITLKIQKSDDKFNLRIPEINH